jgi:hypothetical protein
MYHISNFCHSLDGHRMGCHGFCINLAPELKAKVALAELTQQHINQLIKNCGRYWLDATGYDAKHDPDSLFRPDQLDLEYLEQRKPGPRARPLYNVNQIRVAWGEWGPEHITVPGDACGLDLDLHGHSLVFKDGICLVPHNVDVLRQKYLLTIVFLEIMEQILCHTSPWALEQREQERAAKAKKETPCVDD